jgi:hypothetical protein
MFLAGEGALDDRRECAANLRWGQGFGQDVAEGCVGEEMEGAATVGDGAADGGVGAVGGDESLLNGGVALGALVDWCAHGGPCRGLVGERGVESRGDSGEGAVAIMVAECGFFWSFSEGGFEFEPGCETGEETAEGFKVRSDGAGLDLAGCGFDGHFAAKRSFFEGLKDRVGDEFYLLKPVGTGVLCDRGYAGCADIGGESGAAAPVARAPRRKLRRLGLGDLLVGMSLRSVLELCPIPLAAFSARRLSRGTPPGISLQV